MTKHITETFFEVLNQKLENSDYSMVALKDSNRDWSVSYIGSILTRVAEVNNIQDEIELLLGKLGVNSSGFIFKFLSVEELFIGLKFYLISWSTMKDVMANLINYVFDLGIDEKDLKFGQLLRNRKVKLTKIPGICAKYASIIKIGNTDGARNNAVHRGNLSDIEVTELKNRKTKIQSKRFSSLELNPITEDEYKKQMNEFHKELSQMVTKKKEEYTKHYELTMKLNEELSIELAKLMAKQLNNKRI
jgi:hypothetical protein